MKIYICKAILSEFSENVFVLVVSWWIITIIIKYLPSKRRKGSWKILQAK